MVKLIWIMYFLWDCDWSQATRRSVVVGRNLQWQHVAALMSCVGCDVSQAMPASLHTQTWRTCHQQRLAEYARTETSWNHLDFQLLMTAAATRMCHTVLHRLHSCNTIHHPNQHLFFTIPSNLLPQWLSYLHNPQCQPWPRQHSMKTFCGIGLKGRSFGLTSKAFCRLLQNVAWWIGWLAYSLVARSEVAHLIHTSLNCCRRTSAPHCFIMPITLYMKLNDHCDKL